MISLSQWTIPEGRGWGEDVKTPEMHTRLHQQTGRRVRQIIDQYRTLLGIEEAWSIEISVCCPFELAHEAAIWWDAECWYARLFIRCQLTRPMLEWIVLHELCELQAWRTGSLVNEALLALIPLEIRDEWKRVWEKTRNQEIEWRLFGFLGKQRPGHLLAPSEVEGVVEEEPMS